MILYWAETMVMSILLLFFIIVDPQNLLGLLSWKCFGPKSECGAGQGNLDKQVEQICIVNMFPRSDQSQLYAK